MVDLAWINRAKLRQAALAYAKRGWPVLPLDPHDKRPLTDPRLPSPEGEEGLVHGLKDATTDAYYINLWWSSHPDANVGLRTGVVFDALDLDGPEAKAAMPRLAPRYYHEGPISSTGKGYHLLFVASGAKNHTRLAGLPIDYRGDNGYIVAPPSVHPNGHRYVWARDGKLVGVPDWLRPLIFPPKIERRTDPNDPKILDALQNTDDVVTLMGQVTGGEMQRIGNRYVLYCPFHKDDTASLVLYMDTNSFFCFGCGAWGDPLNIRRWLKTGRLRRGEDRKVSPTMASIIP